MISVRFHPAAETEMVEAAAWYEARRAGLGSRFLSSVQDAVNRLRLNPELFPTVEGGVRRCLTRTFPFGVLFRVEPDLISILAVMHLHREPGYWRDRGSADDSVPHPNG